MRTIIIEDQAPAQRILKKYISDIGSLELVETFTDALKALDFLKNNDVDLIFLDVHLPKLSGMDFLDSLGDKAQVILTTAFSDYALDSYEYSVVDYLLKPFSFQRFVKAVSKVDSGHKTPTITDPQVNEIFVKSGHDLIKVDLSELQYLMADGDFVELHSGDKRLLSNETLKHWTDILDDRFVRIHKSYIVNLTHISKVSASHVYLDQSTKIPIGRVYKDEIMSRIKPG